MWYVLRVCTVHFVSIIDTRASSLSCRMANHVAVKLHHEQGAKHKGNVQRKLSDMRKRADAERREQSQNDTMMAKIEAQARKQYAEDQKEAMGASPPPAHYGEWTWDPEADLYYNATLRWYYDLKSKMYYGGEPNPEWTDSPPIPLGARYDYVPTCLGSAPASTAPMTKAHNSVLAPRSVSIGSAIQGSAHPMSAVGGYQMPTTGRIGGAKGVGPNVSGTSSAARGTKQLDKESRKRKKREEKEKLEQFKALPKQEQEAIAGREMARKRVEERTAATFGLS